MGGICNGLTVDGREVGECPYGPMSALWCVSDFDQSQDGLETSVVDVPVAVQIPSADSRHHFVDNLLSEGHRQVWSPSQLFG